MNEEITISHPPIYDEYEYVSAIIPRSHSKTNTIITSIKIDKKYLDKCHHISVTVGGQDIISFDQNDITTFVQDQSSNVELLNPFMEYLPFSPLIYHDVAVKCRLNTANEIT